MNTTTDQIKLRSKKAPGNTLPKAVICATYIFIISLYVVSSPPRIMIMTLIFSAMHESAHILCAKALGRDVSPFRFSFSGLYPDLSTGTPISTLLIYVSGPAVNLVAVITAMSILRGGYSDATLDAFCVNALLFIYNLLPVPFSDGDGIMRTTLSFFLCDKLVRIFCAVLNLVFSIAVFSFFSYRFLLLGTGLFSFVCSFVFMLASLERLFKG